MKEQINIIEAVKGDLAKIEKPSAYIGSAISALNAARDNLTWHAEAEAKALATRLTESTPVATEAAVPAKAEPSKVEAANAVPLIAKTEPKK